jgi:hypothetical protein
MLQSQTKINNMDTCCVRAIHPRLERRGFTRRSDKIEMNKLKYPLEKLKGTSKKFNEL